LKSVPLVPIAKVCVGSVRPLRDPILLLNAFQSADLRSPDAVREAYGILRLSVQPSATGLPITPISVPILHIASPIVPSDVAPVHVGSHPTTESICPVDPIARRAFTFEPLRNHISQAVVSGSTMSVPEAFGRVRILFAVGSMRFRVVVNALSVSPWKTNGLAPRI
jgi:hypothetical protein